ncbi:MAG: glycosyltransferase [Chlorobiaceae bacterium]|nr:glycosyltransferase [Chlorobiaceae bacterium]
MNNRTICGIITLYAPPISCVDNIETYLSYIERLYIVDNTPSPRHPITPELLRKYPNIELLSCGQNIGIAAALNLAINKGLENNYSWLLTMDQDSYFDADQAKRYFESLAVIDESRVAILSPSHENRPNASGACVYEKKDEVMTSGNLLNLSLTRKTGVFNEALFIDSVDHDYCLRANLLGLDVVQAVNCFICHTVGQEYSGSFFFGLKRKTFHIHSPKRMYFIVRNGLYISKTYRHAFPVYTKYLQKHIHSKISKCIRYSDQRWLYIRFVLQACFDYLFNRYGNRVGI